LRKLNRILMRFSLILVARWEPLYLYRYDKPLIPVETYFHLWMLAHHIIGKGKDAYLAALANPISVNDEVPLMTAQTGMYYFSLFRYELMVFDAQKVRLITQLSAPYDEDQKRVLLAQDRESMSKFHRFSDRISRLFSGFYCVAPQVIESFKGPRFDLGYPEMYPTFRQLETGEIAIRSYAQPPAGVAIPVGGSALPAEPAE
ncbi:MAG TPA: hypothetical protein VHM19_09405, partial [Polyangiales bacterium]|nr:hypothetical protein [Polyangiales bacterium]